MANLAAAFELFRRGHFNEATGAALQLLGENPQHYWALYLAAISSAFAHEIREFEKHLSALETAAETNRIVAEEGRVYLHYLKAYYALLSRDTEKALWHYLEIAEEPEGWLARSLIKKFRKVREIDNIAYRVADFIVLPPQLPPPARPAAVPAKMPKKAAASGADAAVQGWQFGGVKQKRRGTGLRLSIGNFSLRRLLVAGGVTMVLLLILVVIRRQPRQVQAPVVPDLQVADSAAVMPVPDASKILYRYKTREGIITDFDRAKELLKANKVNQARYLLQRLVHSNADFQTREKSRTFVGFIPDPDFTVFNDNLRLKNLFEDIRLRRDSLVVIGGELRDVIAEGKGAVYQFMATENGEEFRVHAYRSDLVKEETRPEAQAKKTVQVYGRFKGLVGAQQTVYVEALRVWR